jgi:hypothetical protein
MILRSIVGRLIVIWLILGAWLIARAQTQAAERASLPQRGSELYWTASDELADSAVQFAYMKRFVQLHEGYLSERQCQQYSRIAVNYGDQLVAVTQGGLSAQTEFWNDARAYSINMIGRPGVPSPAGRTSKYWVTTGSEAGDHELRQVVSFEIEEASSHLIRTGVHFPSVLQLNCASPAQTRMANAHR